MSANSLFRDVCRSCEFCFPMGTELHMCPLDCLKPSPGGVGVGLGVALLEGLRQLLHSEAQREQLRRLTDVACASPDPNLDDDGRIGGTSSCRSRAAALPAHGKFLSPPPPVWPDKSSADTWSATGAPRSLVASADAAEKLKLPRAPSQLPPPGPGPAPAPAPAPVPVPGHAPHDLLLLQPLAGAVVGRRAGDKFPEGPQTRRKAKVHLSKIRRSSQ